MSAPIEQTGEAKVSPTPSTPTRCRKHEWKPLFAKPAPDASKDVKGDWLMMLFDYKDMYVICTNCGCLGSVRRGYSRGGGHATKPIYDYDGSHARLKAEAEAWAQMLVEGGTQ